MIGKIEADLKQAMLAGNSQRVSVLRSLVNALKNEAKTKRKDELDETEAISVLKKEAKQRDESAAAFAEGGAQERADEEKAERAIIDEYLPKALSDEELDVLVEEVVGETGADKQNMGRIISTVMERAAGRADGSKVAQLVKQKLPD